MKHKILNAVARNLREFGYRDATADNVTADKLFAMLGKSQVADFEEEHADNTKVVAVCNEIIAEMQATIDADG